MAILYHDKEVPQGASSKQRDPNAYVRKPKHLKKDAPEEPKIFSRLFTPRSQIKINLWSTNSQRFPKTVETKTTLPRTGKALPSIRALIHFR